MDYELKNIIELVTAFLGGEVCGYDTDGNDYDSLEQMWSQAVGLLKPSKEKEKAVKEVKGVNHKEDKATMSSSDGRQWYSAAYDYWEEENNCPATVDGVLGGFGDVSPMDIQTSKSYLSEVKSMFPLLKLGRALDCGAGIGRVTKHLLLEEFDRVDLLEQSPRLIAAAGDYIGKEASRVRYLCLGMQDYKPKAETYDVVWIQWCVGHLHDVDLLKFLGRIKNALKAGGIICVKDNCCEEVDFVVDKNDNSLTRSAAYLKVLFKMVDFECRMERKQEGFPEELFPVIMFTFVLIQKHH